MKGPEMSDRTLSIETEPSGLPRIAKPLQPKRRGLSKRIRSQSDSIM